MCTFGPNLVTLLNLYCFYKLSKDIVKVYLTHEDFLSALHLIMKLLHETKILYSA